ncbi:MAG: hypothetical protein ACYDC1_00205 [Limisphaerales bacterium]
MQLLQLASDARYLWDYVGLVFYATDSWTGPGPSPRSTVYPSKR